MSHDDFKFEPVRGLPEELPEGEHILWQGSPNALRLAREALCLNWVAGYFVLLVIWRIGASSATYPMAEAMSHGIPLALVGLVACALIYGLAYMQARAAVYTLTNKRVAMRIGAALTMTLNLPYVAIGTAKLEERGKKGSGTIAFELIGDTRFSYILCWPHVRPWHFARTQPALRCIDDAPEVARMFAEAADARVSQPKVERIPANVAASALAAE